MGTLQSLDCSANGAKLSMEFVGDMGSMVQDSQWVGWGSLRMMVSVFHHVPLS